MKYKIALLVAVVMKQQRHPQTAIRAQGGLRLEEAPDLGQAVRGVELLIKRPWATELQADWRTILRAITGRRRIGDGLVVDAVPDVGFERGLHQRLSQNQIIG